jgi:hypothetical protein
VGGKLTVPRFWLPLLCSLCAAVVLMAASGPSWSEPTAARAADAKDALSPAAAKALEFAKTHHPELATLLEQLRANAPKDFDAAVTDLDRTRERLERSRKNTPERYELELAAWKLDSRVRLLAARLAMGGDMALEDELRATLAERHGVRVNLLQDERERTQKRLEKLDEQIADQQRRSDDILAREFTQLRNTRPKPAAKDSVPPRKKDVAKTDDKSPAPAKSVEPPAKKAETPNKKPSK